MSLNRLIMKFLVAYSAFSLLAAALPAALPLEQDLAADGDKKSSSSSLLDRISSKAGDGGKGNEKKGKEPKEEKPKKEPKEEKPKKEDKPKDKPQAKGKEDKKPESKSSGGAKDLLDKLGAKGSEMAKKPDPPKKPEQPKTPAPSMGSLLPGGTRCGPVAVLFSRGTFEVGAQGMAVGSPFTTALQGVLPAGTVFWGNEYVNDVVGYLTGGSVQGSAQMKKKAEEFVDKCPGIKLVLGGYSQGAQVTHHALETANAKTKAAVKAVVLFGDPLSGRPIPGIPKERVKTICASGDTICWGLPVVTLAHMAYGATDSLSAATWVRSKINS